MHIIVVTVVLSIVGLIMSLAFVGIVPSFVALILSIYCLVQKKSIARARALALSVVGVILPIIMYINSYGISAPHLRADGLSFVAGIIYGFGASGSQDAAGCNRQYGQCKDQQAFHFCFPASYSARTSSRSFSSLS